MKCKAQPAFGKALRISFITLVGLTGAFFGTGVIAADAAVSALAAGRLENAEAEPNNWLSHGRTYSEQRYSPLAQINTANVKNLRLSWYYDFDDHIVVEATPLVVDGFMFVTTAMGKVVALDSLTGREAWRYDPDIPMADFVRACCQPVNRGVAYWQGKVFVGTFSRIAGGTSR